MSRAWRKKERPARRTQRQLEQEGEEHHGGDVHKALEGEKGSHFPAAAAQILDNLIGKTHENIVAGVEKNHPGQ